MKLFGTTTTKTSSGLGVGAASATGRLLRPLSYLCCLWLLSSSYCCLMANGEFYSSVDSLKILGNMEATLLQNYRQYLKAQRQDINILQRFIEHIKYHHELAEEDVEDYLGNPINAFTLIKRLVNDWKEVNELLKLQDVRNDLIESLNQFGRLYQLPDDNELKGAIRGLGRLQTVYNLKTEDMANGKKYGSSLSWRDCFEIGTTLLDDNFFHIAVEWLELSQDKLVQSNETSEIKSTYTTHIKEYLALNYQSLGKSRLALKHLDDILAEDPEHPVKITKKLIASYESGEDVNVGDMSSFNIYNGNQVMTNYSRLCRGEQLERKDLRLKCFLDSKRHPFFILAPLAVEPILEEPSITLYHNLLNDEQISKLILDTESRMERSQVVKSENTSVTLELRVSQQVWVDPLQPGTPKLIRNVLRAITGFNMNNSELMQVANYGIGGQYEPHHDFLGDFRKRGQERGLHGDRISTNMFYLSDVEQGGYTVFPYLDVYLRPVKGAMVMWYNLHKSVDSDHRTLHAGCPVVVGSKKIANIWTRAEYQEFVRPCDLKNDKVMQ